MLFTEPTQAEDLEIAPPLPIPTFAALVARAAAAAGLKRGGFVDDARRAATPYVVDCHGLNRENLGDEPYRFERELRERAGWCDENGGLCEIEPLRESLSGNPHLHAVPFLPPSDSRAAR